MTGMLFATGNWKNYMLRLKTKDCEMMGEGCVKVLIVLWMEALFYSRPCMEEIATALENKATVIVLRCEDVEVPEETQWPLKENEKADLDAKQAHMLRRAPVVAVLKAENSIPTPGRIAYPVVIPFCKNKLVYRKHHLDHAKRTRPARELTRTR